MGKAEIVKAAYEHVRRKKGGELPTSKEVAQAADVRVKYARDTMRALGLDYRRRPGGGAYRRDPEAYDAKIRSHYEAISRSSGRAPTAHELNIALGYKRHSSAAHDISRRMGLELTPIRKKKVDENGNASSAVSRVRSSEIPHLSAEFNFERRAVPVISRILEIKRSGAPESRPTQLALAGSGYGITDRVMITCPVCGAQKLISPRMHPHWLRNQAGETIFVDKEACTGRVI